MSNPFLPVFQYAILLAVPTLLRIPAEPTDKSIELMSLWCWLSDFDIDTTGLLKMAYHALIGGGSGGHG